jgi:hypothetical protein
MTELAGRFPAKHDEIIIPQIIEDLSGVELVQHLGRVGLDKIGWFQPRFYQVPGGGQRAVSLAGPSFGQPPANSHRLGEVAGISKATGEYHFNLTLPRQAELCHAIPGGTD